MDLNSKIVRACSYATCLQIAAQNAIGTLVNCINEVRVGEARLLYMYVTMYMVNAKMNAIITKAVSAEKKLNYLYILLNNNND